MKVYYLQNDNIESELYGHLFYVGQTKQNMKDGWIIRKQKGCLK